MTRLYSSISVETTLATAISSTQTTMSVTAGTGSGLLGGVTLAAGNVDQFTVAIDPDTTNEEIVFITAASADTFTIVRGRAGSSNITHGAGALIRHVMTSNDLDFFKTAIQPSTLTAKGDTYAATASGVVTRLPVGTNNQVLTADSTTSTGLKWSDAASGDVTLNGVQTLTNKTLTAPKINVAINAQTGTTYSLVAADQDKLVTLTNSSGITLTVPNGVFSAGQVVNLAALGTGQVTVASDGTTVINSANGLKLRARYSTGSLICTASNTFLLVGDISA